MPKLTVSITTKFSEAESEQLKLKAEAAGVPLRTYIRRSVLGTAEVSRETARMLMRMDQLAELTTRIWTVAASGKLTPELVEKIAAQVDAIDVRVLAARVQGAAQ